MKDYVKDFKVDKINNQILQGAKAVFFQQKEIQNRAFFPVSDRFIPCLLFLRFVDFICRFLMRGSFNYQVPF